MDSSNKFQKSDLFSGNSLQVAFTSFIGFPGPPLVDGFALELDAFEVIMSSQPYWVLLQENRSQFFYAAVASLILQLEQCLELRPSRPKRV